MSERVVTVKTFGSRQDDVYRTGYSQLHVYFCLTLGGMNSEELAHPKSFDPNFLLDALVNKLRLANDSDLSDVLEVSPALIVKIRYRRLPVGASLLVRMREVSGLSTRALRNLMGDRRSKYRGNGTL
ncbi:MAG: hypothetical protein JWM42_1143 [Burkholderia sp.]|nr:hypothetical protein [Burkholderia sp.]